MNRVCVVASGIGLVMLLASCEKKDKPPSLDVSGATAGEGATTETRSAAPDKTPTAEGHEAAKKPAVSWKNVGLSTPESIIYDEAADQYLVSNIDGKPTEADGKAFISKLSPDGTVATLKWIEGGKNNVTLNAPKGMAIDGDALYVADLDTLRVFDRKTGMQISEVKLPGAMYLNDVTVAADGRVIVTASEMKKGAEGLEKTGIDAVYSIQPMKAGETQLKMALIAKSKELGGPNGVFSKGDKTWIATFGSGELYPIDSKGKKGDAQKLPKGALDGVLFVGDDVIVSSWDANAIYRGKPGGELKVVIEGVKSPADIGYDKKRGRVLVPLFTDNEIRAYDLK